MQRANTAVQVNRQAPNRPPIAMSNPPYCYPPATIPAITSGAPFANDSNVQPASAAES